MQQIYAVKSCINSGFRPSILCLFRNREDAIKHLESVVNEYKDTRKRFTKISEDRYENLEEDLYVIAESLY